jgi:malonyl-CoA/methylmalonyl-CoA synthetase
VTASDHNLYGLLRSRFPADRSQACLIRSGGVVRTYGEVEDEVARLRAWLAAKAVQPGDRVLVQAAKTPELLSLYLAVLASGAVYTPLNDAYTPAEVDYFRGDAEPRLVVTDAAAAAREAVGLDPLPGHVRRAGGHLAALIYTSGTTGRSKGAMLTHRNLASNGLALQRLWGFTGQDVLLHALPLFHVHGLFVGLHCALLAGARMLWLPRFEVETVLESLPRATVMMGVPTYYSRLLERPDCGRDHAAQMRLFISGSAPLLASTFREFEARTGHAILERYGMSEAGMITSNPLDGERVPGSVGYPLPGVSLRLSERGVIEIKGSNVFAGYWRMPERTAAEFTADGWFVTGDVGRIDPDGRVWITGREKDLIISGGFNVYPKEVELLVDEEEEVVESAVIGVPHPDFGEAVVAVIVGEADEAALIARLRRRLAPFKVPKRVIAVAALPRNAMGKVQKARLRELYADLFAGP